LGGQDWDGPHLMVGRLLLGHTVRSKRGGWGRQVNMKTTPCGVSAGLSGQTPPTFFPFHSLRPKGCKHRRDRGRDPTELDYQLNRCLTARPVRATPATSSLPAGYGRGVC